jgi:succinyl-CoA synthetase alpha subunit
VSAVDVGAVGAVSVVGLLEQKGVRTMSAVDIGALSVVGIGSEDQRACWSRGVLGP